MIIWDKGDSYDGSYKFVMYENDDAGRLQERRRKSDIDDQISTFYEQRRLEMERLEHDVLSGAISPIALFMTYQNLTIPDLAVRMKLSKRRLKKHLTPKGFRDVTVDMLRRYARVFDVTVADLFQFMHVGDGVEVKAEQQRERLLQVVKVAVGAGSPGERDDEND